MKKYEAKDLKEAINTLKTIPADNIVLNDLLQQLETEFKKQSAVKFVKASDAYMKNIKYDDCYTRPLKEGEYGYYPGMYGCFEKSTDKLLRRHTDLGYLRGNLKHF